MREECLIKLKSIVQDLIYKEIRSKNKDKSVIFYIGLIEHIFSHKSLLYKIISDNAEELIKNIEGKIVLNDSIAISTLLAMCLLGNKNQKVNEKINTYLHNRLADFEYSPLKNAMMLFLLCQCIDYLDFSIKDVISRKLTDLIATSHTFENACLIYASSLILNKNKKEMVLELEKSTEKIIQYKPKEMTLSQSIYALWFYEMFIASDINFFGQALKLQIEKWNRELKKNILPQLFKELSSKPIKTTIEEDLINEPVSISTFELALIYGIILKNEDKFLIISQQDFTDTLVVKCKNIFLERVKWQSYFWGILLIAFFTLPWYLLSRFNFQLIITAMIGVLMSLLTFYLRYKHIKYFILKKGELIPDNYKSLISSLFFGILIAYASSFINVKKFFQLNLRETPSAIIIPLLGVIGILLPHLITPLKKILNNLLFSIKLYNELNEGRNYEIK